MPNAPLPRNHPVSAAVRWGILTWPRVGDFEVAAGALEDDALREKFIDCASRAAYPITRTQAMKFADRVFSLTREPDVTAVFQSLRCTAA